MKIPNGTTWLAGAVGLLAVASLPAVVLKLTGGLDGASDKRFAAVLGLAGVLATACVALVSERRLQRQHQDDEARLRLDAAMKAGALFNATSDSPADPAAVASGLLALTELGRADLAVALLVDLWDESDRAASPAATRQAVSDETAVLVIDAALRSDRASAQLVGAELLCRNARRLDPCQSLHWPSSVDGTWNPHFGVKTKVLLVEALVRSASTSEANLNALQSVAVRLYGFFAGDPDPHVKGCVGILLKALVPALHRQHVTSLMQGPAEVTLADIRVAAGSPHTNSDKAFFQVVTTLAARLSAWADRCRSVDERPGALAATCSSARESLTLTNARGTSDTRR